ncbi:Intradiol ring-cleavage dioxygenase [Sphaerosporella brunnea]|uniref:Intradiol ring-cleavage dioxygenase n=1 Tax=Sphaerosporella brunnea TaxID=1250544 RepID=A0A5J5EPH2_9PEZI|nr:Intradiol ring-cleavage dioxygenase [Sphaerosporella brunnea]
MPANTTVSPGAEQSLETFKATLNDDFTNNVINSMAPETPERARVVLTSLIRHLHSFARDVQLLHHEWMLGVNTLNRAGQMSDDKRNEGVLVSDILGLEALVDQITQESMTAMDSDALTPATLSCILGPFFRENAPKYPNGADIVTKHTPDDPTCFMEGRVYDNSTGKPVANAEIDIWHTAPNGLYEQQDPEQPEYNNRGKFFTDENGYYSLKCLSPTSYPIPYDGPAGDMLKLMGRHPMRPAHIHIMVRAHGYTPLTTQIYDSRDPYTKNDSVFAVKDSLVVEFIPSKRVQPSLHLNWLVFFVR